jgi:GH43 family beta-xylosidase
MNLWILGRKTRRVAKYVINGITPTIADVTNLIVAFMERPVTIESEPMKMCIPGKS